MRTAIDRAGRIVVPKPVRDAMGLTPGRKVDIVFTDGHIEIEPVPVEVDVVMKDGIPALRAAEDLPAPDRDSVRDTLEQIRDERGARHV